MGKITKAVIPAAGLGTRFLPATKALPKEMLPVVDKPAIQYVVEEAVSSGLEHVLMITGRNKNALENHFDRAIELENLLEGKGDAARLSSVSEATYLADIHYVRQGDPAGLGHAISKAHTFTGEDAFAVLLGDEIIKLGDELLGPMLRIAEERSATVVALSEVPSDEIHRYGVPAITSYESDTVVGISGFVEKPQPENAPSSFAIIGRYVLQPSIYSALERVVPGVGGEIQLTDALNLMASDPETYGPVIGFVFAGKRYDTGDKLSYLKAIVEIAVEREDLGKDFGSWLRLYTFSMNIN